MVIMQLCGLPFAVDGAALAAVDGGERCLRSKGEVIVGGGGVDSGGDDMFRVTWEETSGNVSMHGISR
jgi:hypothetical protein